MASAVIQSVIQATRIAPAGVHTTLPSWLGNASAAKRQALKATPMVFADWHATTSRERQAPLKLALATNWNAHNQVDSALATLQTPQQFAAPLLQQALKQRFGLDADVTTTYLHLYTPLTTPLLPVPTGGAKVWTVSLLSAALHNFDAAESQPHAYTNDSTFITQPSATGQFDTLPSFASKVSIRQFIQLCRELDIGARYQRYLKRFFGFEDATVKATLRDTLIQSLKAEANTSLHMARLKKDVSDAAFYTLQGQLEGLRGMMLEGKLLLSHDLSLMAAPLTGIVLFAADLEAHHDSTPVVAYIPGDPQAPLKYYPNGTAFMLDLTSKLRSADYQKFFCRFVKQEHRGYFFADLNNRLSQVAWHKPKPGDPRPAWREKPVAEPNLQFFATKISGGLYEHLYENKLNQLLNDARVTAVSSADADRQARWQRWSIVQKVAKAILEVAAFIATPFIPPLGALMLGYTAFQLLDDTFEGILDWAEGLKRQAFGHLMSILEQMVQLGMFAVGAPIAESLLRQALPQPLWDFFDTLHPVSGEDGKTRRWKPDLTPYAHDITLAAESSANPEGLHTHQGKQILALDGKHFAVEQRAGHAFMQHPTRPHAYRPQIMGNGAGAWVTEVDQPLSWDRATLLRRQGPLAEHLSDARLEEARLISGTDEPALRKQFMDRQPPPPLLADALKRVTLDQQLQDFIDQMNSDDPELFQKADSQTQLWLLSNTALWPASKTLRFLDAEGRTLWELKGKENAAVVQVHQAQLKNGDLLKTLLETLDEPERKILLEEEFGAAVTQPHVRAAKLRKRLARKAEEKRFALFDARYRSREVTHDPRVQKIIDTTPGLPTSTAEEVLREATGQELLEIDQGSLPATLTERARWAAHQVRISRAYEGLYLDSVDSSDTHRLALHTLQKLPGWSPQVRLVVTDYSRTGRVRDSIGTPQAPIQRTLVRTAEGAYVPENGEGTLFGETDFYTAVLQALPDAQRDALGMQIGQGRLLRQTLRQHALTREEVGTLLAEMPVRKPLYDPKLMRLPGGMEGYDRTSPTPGPSGQPSLEDRLRDLYPSLNPEEVRNVLEAMRAQAGPPLLTLQSVKRELLRLQADLATWLHNTPQTFLDTQIPLSRAVITAERHNRARWVEEIVHAWRHETPSDSHFPNPDDNGLTLRLTQPIYGELPKLSANFDHISYLELNSYVSTRGTPAFLAQFPKLRSLNIHGIALRTLPTEVTSQPHLNDLTLRNTAIKLTAQSRENLASLRGLKTLDLSSNPLTLAPNLEHMTDLQLLNLSHTEIAQAPQGLTDLPHLIDASLSDNQFQALPDALFTLPAERAKAFDFSGNPLSRATLERVKTYCQQTGEHFGADAGLEERRRVHELYPTFTDREASQFIFKLPRSLDDAMATLTDMKADYERLQTDLEQWAVEVPERHPVTHAPLDTRTRAQQQITRRAFKTLLQDCWRRETALYADHESPRDTHELVSTHAILGDLPALNVSFNHVARIELVGEHHTSIPPGFLKRFPQLESLLVHRYALPDIPLEVFNLAKLRSLSLTFSGLRLSPASADALSGLEHLNYLDLSENPLGITPNVRLMTGLSTLMLSNAGLTEAPAGAFNLPLLDQLDLSDNQITELPSDILEITPDLADGFDLNGNPLSPATIAMLRPYYRRHAVDFGVVEVTLDPQMNPLAASPDVSEEEMEQ
ncbi:leucine-rich repeat domain-containing protein [Pseudomonas asgharzadehiana]|uniref:dermonecrotic toxin domain-containing protein n=1 Tax=Pseudomonas asgharzadehiana TaxID=2842349 RepID=UPI0034D3E416